MLQLILVVSIARLIYHRIEFNLRPSEVQSPAQNGNKINLLLGVYICSDQPMFLHAIQRSPTLYIPRVSLVQECKCTFDHWRMPSLRWKSAW
jgi:hypothetical protein